MNGNSVVVYFYQLTSVNIIVMNSKGVLVAIASLLFTCSCVQAYFISVDANSEECFFEQAQRGEKMTLTFEVAEGGFLDIDVNVSLLPKQSELKVLL